jgi:hypothetical protein
LFIHVQGDLINFIIIAYGIHPSCGHVLLQGGSYTNKIPGRGSSCPRTFLGSYPPRSKTKDQPMPQAWVPWTMSRGPRQAAMIHISQVCKLANVSHSCNHQQNSRLFRGSTFHQWLDSDVRSVFQLQRA